VLVMAVSAGPARRACRCRREEDHSDPDQGG